MATSLIQVRINEQDKKQADELLAQLGLDMGTAIRIFIKQVLNRGGLPFKITKNHAKEFYDDNFYNKTNVKMIKASIDELENGGGVYKELINE
ncbi:type II toxin-antitoxin system RelB/DinJ family antitoxin [Campylobacter gastrosuis]|uniref:Type II toxin-antitoxin system RelB/DinJ family antitoxin n=1 Tax=Campylobacter gastrosuis TaxID=2974576 RepID=A0ABT7HSJ9_9BACT|nr:type II toxin-antitoxin system RelB/DinJ family antitoxin [Campylobacter gastrosuis]MDL0089860.1 type II toxin-antitoxin system RelB/DinJ family antitoxin [Campylobacter gastrosuis]